jgi:hypothetical protein
MIKAAEWFKKHKIITSLLAFIFLWYVWFHPPFKSTDPASPMFVESLFRLRDYDHVRSFDIDKLKKDLSILFPVGTPKEYVDLMLIDRGGAYIVDQREYTHGKYRYKYQSISLWATPDAWIIDIYYDQNNKVEAIGFGTDFIVGKGYHPKDVAGDK